MKDNEVLLIYGNKLPLKIKVKPYYKDFLFNSYTKVKPVKKEAQNQRMAIEYIDVNVGVDG